LKQGYSINFGYQSKLEFIPMVLPLGQIFLEINEKDDCIDECIDALYGEHFFNGMVV